MWYSIEKNNSNSINIKNILDQKANERKRKVYILMRLFFLHFLLRIEYKNDQAFTIFKNSYDKLSGIGMRDYCNMQGKLTRTSMLYSMHDKKKTRTSGHYE